MPQILGGKNIIMTDFGPCEFCGTTAELRPYGPNAEEICVKCAKKDIETTHKMMKRALLGVGKTRH